jgi:hypothetical protein
MALSLGFGIRTVLRAHAPGAIPDPTLPVPSQPSLVSALAALVFIGLLSNMVGLGGGMGLAAWALTDPQPIAFAAVALWFLDLLAALGLIWLWRRVQAGTVAR